jgi:hypothetical protein
MRLSKPRKGGIDEWSPGVRQHRAVWWKRPFTPEPWRRTLYVALAAPAALIAVADGGRLQQQLASRLLSRDVRAVRWRGLLELPLHVLAFVITAYGWAIVALNLAYPVRWLIGMGGPYADAWGGPTFAGAWAFHATFGGLTFLFAMPWILEGVTGVQARLLGTVSQ